MAEIKQEWNDTDLKSDKVGKKDIIAFLQSNAAPRFLSEHKLQGSLKNAVKTSKKDNLIIAYNEFFEKKAYKDSEYDIPLEKAIGEVKNLTTATKQEIKTEVEVPKFTKTVLKKGDKTNFPKPGDKVSCYYVGKLTDGTVFDSLQAGGKRKKNMPLSFKVGKGNVIKGWDEALMVMSVGEKAEITIEPEWAYGKRGKPEAKIPPNATLIFEVELLRID